MFAKKTKKHKSDSGEVRLLPISKLTPTPDNQRGPITEASIRALAKDIEANGLLHPLVVRPHPTRPDRWEIRAGERRWRALKLLGRKEIAAQVRELDDEAALAVTVAENFQRENLHPLEEAEAIQLAFERGYDLKGFAARLGRTLPYIARRASLTRLTTAWKDEIRKPNSAAGRFSVAHLELVARLPEPTQMMLAEDDFRPVFGRGFSTLHELRRIIDQDLRSLDAIPWKLTDETIVPEAGSCTQCPKRSSHEPLLFAGAEAATNGKAAKNDRCLDPACYERKFTAHLIQCEATLGAQHSNLRLVQLGYEMPSPAVAEAFGERIERIYFPKLVKAKDPHATPALQVAGPQAGKLVYLDLGNSVEAASGRRNARPRDENGKVVPMTLVERRARLQKRRDAFVVNKVRTEVLELTKEKALALVSPWAQRRNNRVKGQVVCDPMALITAFGTMFRSDSVVSGDAWSDYDRLRNAEPTTQWAATLLAVTHVWAKRLGPANGNFVGKQAEDGRRMCEVLGWDHAALVTEAEEAIPEPKAWAYMIGHTVEKRPRKNSESVEVPWREDSNDETQPKRRTIATAG